MLTEAPTTPRRVVETLLLDLEERRKLLLMAQARYGISKDQAEDLLQDVAVDLLRQRQVVRRPHAYLRAVLRFRCSHYVRAQRSHGEIEPVREDILETGTGTPEVDLDQQVFLRQALHLISPTCRKVLKARYFEGQSLKASAARITLAYSGITKTISRCLKRLRACLA
jgi:RNA polymerase sigma factor, sigma-70 family